MIVLMVLWLAVNLATVILIAAWWIATTVEVLAGKRLLRPKTLLLVGWLGDVGIAIVGSVQGVRGAMGGHHVWAGWCFTIAAYAAWKAPKTYRKWRDHDDDERKPRLRERIAAKIPRPTLVQIRPIGAT